MSYERFARNFLAATPTGKRARLRPVTKRRDYISHRAWSGFVLESAELSENVIAVMNVAAASLLIASRGGANLQKFEKRALTIFRLEPDPYKPVHQLNWSLLFLTAMANGIESTQAISLLSNHTNNKLQRRLIVNTVSETQQKQTKSILPGQLTEQANLTPIA